MSCENESTSKHHDDSRVNPFEERGNDGNQGGPSFKDMLHVLDWPNTNSRA